MRAEEARLRAEAAARREEAARYEAIRIAAMEKARIEAEQAAKIALLTKEHEHERKLAALELEQQRHALRRAVIAGAALIAAIVGTFAGAYFGHLRPEAARVHRREAEAIAAREAYVAQLKADVARANQRVAEARRALAQPQREAAPAAGPPDP
jgi:colicin import membrane protein